LDYLLDTSTLVQWVRGLLPAKLTRQLGKPTNRRFVSILTHWEIAIKPALARRGLTTRRIQEALGAMDAQILSLSVRHIESLHGLPFHRGHTDPFDRMLIAQALAEGMVMVSGDARFPLYESVGLRLLWR
jgi:PIN domain nuclease of toxin-antitoxin system